MTNQRGFTLVELMVTVSIMAILLGIGAPAMQTMVANNRVASQTNDFVGALQLARSESIKLNRSIQLCRTADAGATTCANAHNSGWTHWAVLDGTTALRRGAPANPLLVTRQSNGNAVAGMNIRPTGLIDIIGVTDTDTVVVTSTAAGASRNSARWIGPTGQVHSPSGY